MIYYYNKNIVKW